MFFKIIYKNTYIIKVVPDPEPELGTLKAGSGSATQVTSSIVAVTTVYYTVLYRITETVNKRRICILGTGSGLEFVCESEIREIDGILHYIVSWIPCRFLCVNKNFAQLSFRYIHRIETQ